MILAYAIGSVSTSTIISRYIAHLDIREHGSGNAGATNTLRVLGLRWALLVLALDILKGMVAVAMAKALGHNAPWYVYLSGLAVIVGHNWPVFFGFRGGKGIATAIGVYVLVMFVPAVVAGVIAIALVAFTRFVSLGALTFAVLTPICASLLHPRSGAVVFASLVAILSIYTHRHNIVRLLHGEEHKIFQR